MNHPESLNPLALSCPNCGAAARYDVAAHSCRCPYCGALSRPEEQLGLVEHWRSLHRAQLRDRPALKSVLLSCPNCAAQVAVEEEQATASCAFCGGNLVRRELTRLEELPDLILPFQLGPEEAKAALQRWAKKQKGKNRRRILKNVQHLQGYYLPCVFVRGSIDCEVFRDRSERRFHCSGYVDKIAVNASKQLRNDVLDAVEPFRWEECRPFAWEYLAGQRVKLRDLTGADLAARVRAEVEGDFLPVVEKTMETRGVSLRLQEGALVEMPLLLPVYILSQNGLCVAVNGQTGAVAGWFGEQRDSNRFWFIEPTLTTLAVFLLSWFLSKTWMMGGMFGLTAGLISFVAFGQDKESHIRDVVRGVGRKRRRSAQVAPVFREQLDGEWVNVKVSFFPLLRVLRFLVMGVLFNVLPLLIALLLAAGKPVQMGYIGIWLVISVPMTFIFWIAYLRRDIYDRPVIHQILPDGRRRRIRPDADRKGKKPLGVTIGEILKDLRPDGGEGCLFGCLLFGLPVLMFVMSIVCMLD